jgi:hypothetical protein
MKTRTTSLSLFTNLCLTLVVVPAPADTLYSNGPCNCDTDAWYINFGFSVSDSFLVANNSAIEGLHFVYWDASSADVLTTVEVHLSDHAKPANEYHLKSGQPKQRPDIDSRAVSAMLDCLLHHGHLLKRGPRSWRTKLDAPGQ